MYTCSTVLINKRVLQKCLCYFLYKILYWNPKRDLYYVWLLPMISKDELEVVCYFSAYLLEKPSLELCKSLIMLRDFNISGRINVLDIPVLMHMLQFWRVRCIRCLITMCFLIWIFILTGYWYWVNEKVFEIRWIIYWPLEKYTLVGPSVKNKTIMLTF